MQWKLPGSISAFVQHAGRCACASGHVGLVVLLAEPSAYSTVLDEHGQKPNWQDGKTSKKKKAVAKPTTNIETKAKKNYAEVRGIKRGATNGQNDAVLVQDCPTIM
jgi:hypothetical protein